MAKVRVYELAREFNMESKELVEKLLAGGVNIKNYMSTLDEEAVARAKDIVTGVVSVSEVIEEKRIKPTVIRRRKKTVKVEPEEHEVIPEEEDEEPEEVLDATAKETTEESEESPGEVDEKEPAEEVEAQVPMESAPEGVVEETVSEAVLPDEELETGEEVVEDKKAPPKQKAKEKSKKGKKKKADQPAKIIKPPEEGPLKALLEKKREEAEKKKKVKEVRKVEKKAPIGKGAEAGKVVTEPVVKDKSPKKKKEKKKTGKKDEAEKSSVRHRKLAVFERADLYEGRTPRLKERKADKKAKEAAKRLKKTEITVPKAIKRRIKVPENMTVSEISKAMGIKANQLLKKLMSMGVGANLNQSIDYETASLIADEFGYELELDIFEDDSLVVEDDDKPEDMMPRPPVVTIMGHVDHGKTSLLDFIRSSNIIDGESGGITQHIGAYHVKREGGDIVFLDTPGHEAFTAMRARGAKVTDIIVLVVAADDGVMPQTVEAVNHARAADIPIIVAVNKIDKAEANPDKVRRELAELDLIPEDWGGTTIYGNISAKTGEGIEEMMELIQLQSEILELKANPDKSARGTIIEAKLDKTRGSLATVLIKSGTLNTGNFFVCGECSGKVRAMMDFRGKTIDSASPSIPAEIYGISGVPMAGDEFVVVKDEKTAKQIAEHRRNIMKASEQAGRDIVSLDDLYEKIKEGGVKELNIVLKADVQGSAEALSESLIKLSTDEVKLKIIHVSTGAISESDVMLSSASNAIIIGFNVRANPRVADIAEKETVDIRYYDVIYNVIKDVRAAMAGLLDPLKKEKVIGRADVLEIFHVPKVGTVAGCMVSDGFIERNAFARLLRDEVVIFDGKISSLRRFKDDVKEVQSGYECGIGLENFQDVKPADVFEAYQIEEVEAEL